MEADERRNLAAPCGLYCGACSIYLAQRRGDAKRLGEMAEIVYELRGWVVSPEKDLICDGCLSQQVAAVCRRCAIRACAKDRETTLCADCVDFPCATIIGFKDDGRPHHGEVLVSVGRQREIGIERWLDEQERRWRCAACGTAVEWYDRECLKCGAGLPARFKE